MQILEIKYKNGSIFRIPVKEGRRDIIEELNSDSTVDSHSIICEGIHSEKDWRAITTKEEPIKQ